MYSPNTLSALRKFLSFAFAALIIFGLFRISLEAFQTGPWYAGAFFLVLGACFLFWTAQAALAWSREYRKTAGYPLGATLLFLGFVAVMGFQIWDDVTRPQRAQESERRDKARRDKQDQEWEQENPKQAAELRAKFERTMAATDRQLKIPSECLSETTTFEAYENCTALAKRAESMRCLQRPDWKDCVGVK